MRKEKQIKLACIITGLLLVLTCFASISYADLTVPQGITVIIKSNGASSGLQPYSYQWFNECPSCSGFNSIALATNTSYYFNTNTLTQIGIWQFQLQATDGSSTIANSIPVNVIVLSALTSSSTSTSTISTSTTSSSTTINATNPSNPGGGSTNVIATTTIPLPPPSSVCNVTPGSTLAFLVNIGTFEAGIYVLVVILLIIINAILIVRYVTSKKGKKPGIKTVVLVLFIDFLIILPIITAALVQCIKA